jgi:hypothetical protein
MKKAIWLCSVLIGLFSMCGTAHAVPVTFVDTMSDLGSISVGRSLTYTHSILDEGFIPSAHSLSSADLTIDFNGIIAFATVTMDNIYNGTHLVWFLDDTLENLNVDVNLLQDDGQLTVTLKNEVGLKLTVTGSRLTATGNSSGMAATPEPATMSLLGLGVLGLGCLSRLKKTKK